MLDWDKYPNFSEKEMACSCPCGKADMDPNFMMMLQSLRTALARPLIVTSAYRCHDYNDSPAIKGGPAHPEGKAADISTSRQGAYQLTKLALLHGFSGIGWKQHGDNRFVHLDTLTSEQNVPRPTCWSYP